MVFCAINNNKYMKKMRHEFRLNFRIVNNIMFCSPILTTKIKHSQLCISQKNDLRSSINQTIRTYLYTPSQTALIWKITSSSLVYTHLTFLVLSFRKMFIKYLYNLSAALWKHNIRTIDATQ